MLRTQSILLLIVYFLVGNVFAIEDQSRVTKEINLQLTHTIDSQALSSGRVVVHSRLVNKSQETITFLPWNTPLDSYVTGRIFNVFLLKTGFDKQLLNYHGRMVKRQAPHQSDFISLESKQTTEQSLDLTKLYNFCAGKRYSLSFRAKFFTTDSKVNSFIESVNSEEVEFETNRNFSSCAN